MLTDTDDAGFTKMSLLKFKKRKMPPANYCS